ncbi:hypothetical protein SERLA73DRAFT_72511 [Serpula lacrymans var. lacrymans S7.3]|uniref:Uncharacterized protein n=1 Tax=Serpula lacrymans var. lacrymans (strain S7.3) TaxID=936435 RepID=F8PUU7_SERL3|nr:hypothetical protein SERLA73DRAFT_72511 [Serpula lacrymans var. lacrymans S7.3]
MVAESARNASLHSIHPSDPHCPLQLDANIDWNADTGATSHMTPYRTHYKEEEEGVVTP